MSTWNDHNSPEPSTTATELLLADFLARVTGTIERGDTPNPDEFPADRPDLAELCRALVRNVTSLCDAMIPSASQVQQGIVPFSAPPESHALPDPFPGDYRVGKLLGSGSYAKVWLAEEMGTGRVVALKTPSNHDQIRLAALQREARLLAKVDHPNVVRVWSYRTSPITQEDYLVLKYVLGGSLAERVRGKRLDWQTAGRYVADVARGLRAVHDQNILHRDVKPANILWDPQDDRALLTDFGVSARLTDAPPMAGTRCYMAPEALNGRPSKASDVYSLAVTFFKLVTGDVPFRGSSVTELVLHIEDGLKDDDSRLANLPESVRRLLQQGFEARAEGRLPLLDFEVALRGLLQHLADTVSFPQSGQPAPAPVDLRLIVSRQVAPQEYERVAAPQRPLGSKTPIRQSQGRGHLRSGDRIRIEVVADKSGHATVFNVDPKGDLTVLYPDPTRSETTQPDLLPHRTLHAADVDMKPPVGRERLFALWTSKPLKPRPAELQRLAATDILIVSGEEKNRSMAPVYQEGKALAPEEWHAVVLELELRD